MSVRDTRTGGDSPQKTVSERADILVDAARRHIRAILFAALAGLAIGASLSALTDRHEKATASIFVDPAIPSDMGAANVLAREAALIESLGEASGLRTLDVAVDPTRRTLRVTLDDTEAARKLRDLIDAYFASRGRTAEAQVSLVRPPQTAEPAHSSLVGWMALCGLAGLLAGISAAAISVARDQGIRSLEALAYDAKVPVAVAIPPLSSEHLFILRPADRHSGEPDVASFEAALHAMSGSDYIGAGAFRQAVLRLLARLRAGAKPGRPHVVMLAAPTRGTGNTTLAIALAEGAALAGQRVLLIDATVADPAMRRQIRSHDVEHADMAELDRDAIGALLEHDDPASFATLPLAGSGLIRPEINERRRLVAALNGLVQDFDLIFIDAGGILEDEAAASLAPLADQIWYIARHAVAQPHAIAAIGDLLVPVRDRVVGAVMTMAPELCPNSN